MDFAQDARMTGIPHTPGTREYFICEHGVISLTVAGHTWTLSPGDILVFRGDPRHSYHNPGTTRTVAYSTVLLVPD